MKLAAIGFDPGLRHGAIIHSTFDLTEKRHQLLRVEVLYSWTKKDEHIGAKSALLDISQFVFNVLAPKFENTPASIVGIEFSPHSVYWRAQKSQVVTLAFMLGTLSALLQSTGLPVSFISVDQLKKAFSISTKEDKATYTSRVPQLINAPSLEIPRPLHLERIQHTDDRYDAFLLSYLSAYLLSRRSTT